MSETPTEQATPKAEQQSESVDKPLGENGEKALKAERDRAKDLEKQLNAATARLTEIERANESAIERAQREAQEAKAEVEKLPSLVADHLRNYLTGIHGISDENRDLYLTSNDPAVLLRQAAGLAERTPTAGPRPDLSQGGSGQVHAALNGDGLEQALRDKLGIA